MTIARTAGIFRSSRATRKLGNLVKVVVLLFVFRELVRRRGGVVVDGLDDNSNRHSPSTSITSANLFPLSHFSCRLAKQRVDTPWYKPLPLHRSSICDVESCVNYTTRNLIDNIQTGLCTCQSEIFSSCRFSNAMYLGSTFTLTCASCSKRDHNLPGLGLERRHFALEHSQDLTKWGEGAKRLSLSLSRHDVCNLRSTRLVGLSYLFRAYHYHNLGHFYESIFRVVMEMISSGDTDLVKRIILLNAEGPDFPFLHLFQKLFPNVTLTTLAGITNSFRRSVCMELAVFVGFPNFAMGRAGTMRKEVAAFQSYVLSRINLETEPSNNTPIVVFISRKNRNYGGRTHRRYLQNENSLAKLIASKTGWQVKIICMEDLEFESQVSLMQSASLLISVHTAGLFNVVYMEPGSVALQINVPGTHFGTKEYENRPQFPFWRKGMWHTPVERLCEQSGVMYLEDWADPDVSHIDSFKGHWKALGAAKASKEYISWAGENGSAMFARWKECAQGHRSEKLCLEDISNEMRAHSVADKLIYPEERLLKTLSPYLNCIRDKSCQARF